MRRPVTLEGYDPFGHTLVMGTNGTGKTSRILVPMACQVIDQYANGNKCGLMIMEPKGDFCEQIYEYAKFKDVPIQYIDPTKPHLTKHCNVLLGEKPQVIAEMIRTVLKNMFGKQDPFFSKIQELAARNFVLFLKKVKGNQLNLFSVLDAISDPETMTADLKLYEEKYGADRLLRYFRKDVLGNSDFYKFTTGLRAQLDDFLGNDQIADILTGSDSVDFDRHLAEGGVLLINTAMGELGEMNKYFGQLNLMAFQNAVFRRPGNEWTRRPHYTKVDELPLYVNPEIERSLAIGRSLRNACTFAIQSLGQLDIDGYPGFQKTMLNNLRNKIVFGGMSYEDALYFSQEFGEEKDVGESRVFSTVLGFRQLSADKVTQKEEYKRRFTVTQLIELPKFHFVHRLVKGGQPCTPGLIEGKVVDFSQIRSSSTDTGNSVSKERPTLMLVQNSVQSPGIYTTSAPVVRIGNQGSHVISQETVQPQTPDEDWFLLRKAKKERRQHGSNSTTSVG